MGGRLSFRGLDHDFAGVENHWNREWTSNLVEARRVSLLPQPGGFEGVALV
jgi:hypothetical protein